MNRTNPMQDHEMANEKLLKELEQLRQRCAEWECRAGEMEEYYQALRKKEERYRSFYENAVEGFFQSTPDGRFLNVNPAFARMLGYDSPEELISAIYDIERQYYIDPADRARYVNLLKESGAVENFEFKARHRNGSEIWVSNSTQTVYDRDGSILYYEGVVENITKNKDAEAALRKSERRLADIIEFLPDATLAIDGEGRIIAWNKAIEEMTGFMAADMLGKGDYEYALPFYGKRRPILIDFVSKWDEETEKQYSFIHKFGDVLVTETDVPFVRGHNRTLWGKAGPLYDDSGRVIGAIESIRDITERKAMEEKLRKSEEKYRNILENMEEVYFEVDLKGRLTFFNDAACIVSGYSRDELMGMHFKEYTSPETTKSLFDSFKEEFLTGERKDVLDYEIICKNGSIRIMQVSTNLLRNQYGAPIGFHGLARDVTNRRRLEAQLLQAQKMEAVGTLAGGIAHDFNNLLSPILGYTDMLMMGLDPADPRHRKLEQILKAAERSRDLIRQLLAFSRKQILALKPADLRKVVIGFESLLRHTLREDIKIDIKVPKLMATVHADEGQIEQVLMNLAVNAQDAMPGGGVLTLTLTEVEIDELFSCEHKDMKPGHYVLLTVSDTGHGMDKTTQELVFEPFFTTKEQGKGTGLGLSMVYGIIKQHGGHIWVYSEPDQGCTFKICLPVATESEQMPDSSATHPSGMSKGTETILLVEDNDAVRKMTCQALERYHYRVITAENGEQGLEYIKRHQEPIHLLLTDVVMPGINGRELYERLIAIRPEVKVLYMSGYTDDVIAHRGVLNAGVSFIPKPFSINALATKVRDVLDR